MDAVGGKPVTHFVSRIVGGLLKNTPFVSAGVTAGIVGFDFVFDCHARHSPPASVPPLHSATRGPVRNLILKALWFVLAAAL